MKKKLIPLLLFLPLLFLITMYGKGSQKEQRRVVVIVIDGLRWQELFGGEHRDSLMPFLGRMGRNEGCMLGNRYKGNRMEVANGIWKSYAGYSEMLCGVTDDEHIFDNRKQYNPHRSVLEMANASLAYNGKVGAAASWDVIPYILNTRRSGLPVDYESCHRVSRQVRSDSVTAREAMKMLEKKHFKCLFVEFCEADFYGHHGKWKEYLDAACRNDLYIRRLWEYCQKDGSYRGNTTFIITCDHGRGASLGAHAAQGEVDPKASWAEHGRNVAGSNQTWLVAFGNGVRHLGEMAGGNVVYTRHVAPTIASILDVPFANNEKDRPQAIAGILK